MPDNDPLVGSTIRNRYRIVRRLGEGGMGTVYEGTHLTIDRRVAIKCLHPHFSRNHQILRRFHREALAATHTGNEHIIDVIDMDELDDGSPFMVLEYLEGTELENLVENTGPLPLGRVARIGVQICDALDAVHEAGIVHRDLKPRNIFLVPRSSNPDFVKIIDFGISKFKISSVEQSANMTTPGTLLGTPNFMSPEQIDEEPEIDRRADIFALGGILFYSLTANLPFLADNFYSLLITICTVPCPSIGKYRPDLPPEIDAIISKALAKAPGERFSTCAELKRALWPYLDYIPDAISTVPIINADQTDSTGKGQNGHSNARIDVNGSTSTSPISAPIRDSSPILPSIVLTPFARMLRRHTIPMIVGIGAIALTSILVPFFIREEASPRNLSKEIQPRDRSESLERPSDRPQIQQAEPSNVLEPSIEVRIEAVPNHAKLFLNGKPIDNPFRGPLPKPDELYRVKAVYDGRTKRVAFVPNERKEVRLVFPKTSNTATAQPSANPEGTATTTVQGEGPTEPITEKSQSEPFSAATSQQDDQSLGLPTQATKNSNNASAPPREKESPSTARPDYPKEYVPPKRPPIPIR